VTARGVQVGGALVRVFYASCAAGVDMSAKPARGAPDGAALLAPLLAMLAAASAPAPRAPGAPREEGWREPLLLAAVDAASPALYERLVDTGPAADRASAGGAGPAAALAGALLALGAHGPPALASAARARLAALPLATAHAEALLAALTSSLAARARAAAPARDAPPSARKARKGAKSAGADADGGADGGAGSGAGPPAGLPVAMVLLEAIQAHHAPAHFRTLVPALFSLLAAVNDAGGPAAGSAAGDESLVQNVLGAAHALLLLLPPPPAPAEAVAAGSMRGKKGPPQKPAPGRELPEGIDVAALVHALASAASPQTRQEALRCLVAVSTAAPEAMLAHVVPVPPLPPPPPSLPY